MARRVPSRTTLVELREALAAMSLDDQGKKETLVKRLSSAYRREAAELAKLAAPKLPPRRPQPINSFLCFDVEATCIADKTLDWPNEVIEFPVILLQWHRPSAVSSEQSETEAESDKVRTPTPPTSPLPEALPELKIIDQFHSYVKPTWRPALSTFCTSLTGISQATIDSSPTFPEVLLKFEDWLLKHELMEDGCLVQGACWVTDGPWDIRDFIPKQLHISPLRPPNFQKPHPDYFSGPYLDVKEGMKNYLREQWYRTNGIDGIDLTSTLRMSTKPGPYRHAQRSPKFYRNIAGQLQALHMSGFQGREHSGIDDAKNIARILIELARRDVLLETNDTLPPATNMKRYNWMGERPGQVFWDRRSG